MSRLLENSGEFRDKNVVRNSYSTNDNYNVGHENALSDGDELGKGELNGSIGSATDIKRRQALKIKNKFNSTNEYNAGNA